MKLSILVCSRQTQRLPDSLSILAPWWRWCGRAVCSPNCLLLLFTRRFCPLVLIEWLENMRCSIAMSGQPLRIYLNQGAIIVYINSFISIMCPRRASVSNGPENADCQCLLACYSLTVIKNQHSLRFYKSQSLKHFKLAWIALQSEHQERERETLTAIAS